MLIYKMTHLPTGKFYIGSLQRKKIWQKYKTSSKIVKEMMLANPHEWTREILKEYSDDYDAQSLVDEEYQLIDAAVASFGWGGIWNQRGSSNLGSSGYSPNARAKQKEKAKDTLVIAKSKKSKKAYIEANPDYFERISATAKVTWAQPEMVELAKQRASKQFSNPENRKLASEIKKRFLSDNPEVAIKLASNMREVLKNPIKESERRSKIKKTMSSMSKEFSAREKAKHAANPDLGKHHGAKLRDLNKNNPSRLQRMRDSAIEKTLNRPDLVAKSVKAMNSDASRAKMKSSLLAKYGKWVEVTFSDGETVQFLGAKETGRILGIDKVGRKVTQNNFKKPVICKSNEFAGRQVVRVRYIEK
jgi:hypothetical protein